MEKYHSYIRKRLAERKHNGTLRQMKVVSPGDIDFASNDFLGYSVSGMLRAAMEIRRGHASHPGVGATGSRLITGNSALIEETEEAFAALTGSEAALFFNSGYLANLAVLSALGDRDTLFLYDEEVHASIKEGMRAGFSSRFPFRHNDKADLEKLLSRNRDKFERVYVVTEGVFSMEGDMPDVSAILEICREYDAALIIDEAHALGTCGREQLGPGYDCRSHPHLFGRIYPLGKAAGTHGAFFCGSRDLVSFFVNFSRPFIYTTAPAYDQVLSVSAAVSLLKAKSGFGSLQRRIREYTDICHAGGPLSYFSANPTPVQWYKPADSRLLAQGVRALAEEGISVFPIFSPTVRKGEERIRIILHSFNTKDEIDLLIKILAG